MPQYQITGTVTRREQITLRYTDKEYRNMLIEGLERVFQLQRDDWIENGMLRRENEYHTSHSWFKKEDHRPALDIDQAVLDVIKALKK